MKDINVDDLPAPNALSVDNLPSPQELGFKEEPSQLESATRGAIQGATLGYSDELAGALGAVTSPGEVLSAPDKLGKLKELYQKYRDIERQKNLAAEQANPKTYLAGNVAGNIGTMATGLGELGATVKGGALLGAATGLGVSNADLTKGQVGRAAVDTGIGAALGGVGSKVAEGISNLVSPSSLEESAAQNAANALGVSGKESLKQKAGQAAIQSGALQQGVSETALGTMREASEDAENQLVPMLQKIKQRVSDMSPEDVRSSLGGDAGDRVYDLLENAHDSIKNMSNDVTEDFANNIAPKVQDYILKLKQAGDDPIQLNAIKRAAYKQAQDIYSQINKYQRTGNPVPQMFEEWGAMAKKIGETTKDYIEDLGNLAGDNLGDELSEANYYSGGLAEAQKALNRKLIKGNEGFKTSAPIEYAYNPKWALIKDIAKNLGSDTIRVSKALGQSKLASQLESTVGESLTQPARQVAQSIMRSSPVLETAEQITGSPKPESPKEEKQPDQFSRSLYMRSDDQLRGLADSLETTKGFEHVGATLNKALANKDVQAKNAALFLISSNPQTREIVNKQGLLNQE